MAQFTKLCDWKNEEQACVKFMTNLKLFVNSSYINLYVWKLLVYVMNLMYKHM
jgi:hypothetical protein